MKRLFHTRERPRFFFRFHADGKKNLKKRKKETDGDLNINGVCLADLPRFIQSPRVERQAI